jgi:putative Mg2+ transporter-C (MgtC) family protein
VNPFGSFFQFGDVQWRILAYVVIAMVLGALIGWERETLNKPAGLRTHTLVSGAAALLVALGDLVVTHFGQDLGAPLVQTDPIRLIEAVITGVSFLGAGTIIRGQGDGHVEGLTTAASLLFSATIGIAVALSQAVLAAGVTVLALVALRGLGALRAWMSNRNQERT